MKYPKWKPGDSGLIYYRDWNTKPGTKNPDYYQTAP